MGSSSPFTFTDLSADGLIARLGADGTSTYIRNHRGDVIGTVDSNGQSESQATYDSFGNTHASGAAPSGSTFGFTGRELDPTGLYYFRARYYNPQSGRFLNEDPLGFGGGGPKLLHLRRRRPHQRHRPVRAPTHRRRWRRPQ